MFLWLPPSDFIHRGGDCIWEECPPLPPVALRGRIRSRRWATDENPGRAARSRRRAGSGCRAVTCSLEGAGAILQQPQGCVTAPLPPAPPQTPSAADPRCQTGLRLSPIEPAAPLQSGELRFASLTCYPVAVTDCHVLPGGVRGLEPGDAICVRRFRVVILFEDTSAGKVLMQSSRWGAGSLAPAG